MLFSYFPHLFCSEIRFGAFLSWKNWYEWLIFFVVFCGDALYGEKKNNLIPLRICSGLFYYFKYFPRMYDLLVIHTWRITVFTRSWEGELAGGFRPLFDTAMENFQAFIA